MADTAKLRGLVEAKTAGPWAETYRLGELVIARYVETGDRRYGLRVAAATNPSDSAAIVAVMNAAPALLDEIDALRAENARLKGTLPFDLDALRLLSEIVEAENG